jgi:hypothetical protein
MYEHKSDTATLFSQFYDAHTSDDHNLHNIKLFNIYMIITFNKFFWFSHIKQMIKSCDRQNYSFVVVSFFESRTLLHNGSDDDKGDENESLKN